MWKTLYPQSLRLNVYGGELDFDVMAHSRSFQVACSRFR